MSAFSGSYNESGYIDWLKANKDNHCWGRLLYGLNNTSGQGFYLNDCDWQIMSMLKVAQVTGAKVQLILDGNGAESKPLLGVIIHR